MSRLLRRAVAAPVAVFALATSALVVTAAPALADNSSTLTVVGTSDVFDSNLVQSVIKPGFEAANPGVTLNYVSKGTGAAIAYAEAGSASALVVHAASLENQYVDQGFSLEPYGRAIFVGDYVLLGPASDPAKVLTGAKNDIVSAFEKIAAAGVKGKADFVSRGGTPGTTVQEHALWALTNGVPTCTVDPVNGGGEAPSTTAGACPTTNTNPAWYHTTGLTQGPNILAGSACNFGHGQDCYVFTDRGTYQYLQSTNQATNLNIVTRNNGGRARGGPNALVNSFHAYGVNPAAFSDPTVRAGINTVAATAFLDYITSVDAQTAIGNYLSGGQAGAPFTPDASPQITTSDYPASVAAGGTLKVIGSVRNVVPGALALNNVPVTLRFTPLSDLGPTKVAATARTNASGGYSLSYKPTASGTYTVTTDQITKIEDPTLDPVFGDILSPGTSTASGSVALIAAVPTVTEKPNKGFFTGVATVNPAVTYKPGSLVLYAAISGGELQQIGDPVTIPVGNTRIGYRYNLPAGTYDFRLHYVNNGVVSEGISALQTVTVT